MSGLQSRGEDPLADGIHGWTQFEILEFTATFGDIVFTDDHLQNSPRDVLIEIRTTPDGRTFGFDPGFEFLEAHPEVGTGEADFINADGFLLSFQPRFGNRYFANEQGFEGDDELGGEPAARLFVASRSAPLEPLDLFGSFGPETQSSDVPVPAALPLLAPGLAALGGAARRRRR